MVLKGSTAAYEIATCSCTVVIFYWCRSVEVYDRHEDKWSRGTPMPHRESFANCAVLQDQVALLGGSLHGSSMTLYNPITQAWQAAEAPYTSHLHSAVASMQDSLFVLVRLA